MTEHWDKAADKSDKARPGKRGGRSRTPKGKRAQAPGSTAHPEAGNGSGTDADAAGNLSAGDATSGLTDSGLTASDPAVPTSASPRNPLAPDPATITFGSNRPIVAAPPKLPESSGLRFSGPSAGILKASGPQPTSPKASGLTFTSAKAGGPAKPVAAAKPAPKAGNVKADSGKALAGDPAKGEAKATSDKKVGDKKPDAKNADSTPGAAKPAAVKPATTKPAIAPQASGRMFDKERSPAGSLVAVLVVLVVIGSGLSFWLKLGDETPPRESVATVENPASAMTETLPSGPVASVRAPETPGPLVGDTASDKAAVNDALSTAEIEEIQTLLSRLDLDPGSHNGVLTSATTEAIRSYQEMAGLPADGAANKALLDELRTVADLYGG
jgi:hypothetical protein